MSDDVQGRLAGRVGSFRIDAAFDIPGRGVTALSGPSGAGKSTLLRCILGLERVGGSLRIGEEVWQDSYSFVAPHRRRIGMVFQDASLLPHLSVTGNLRYGLRRAPRPHAIALDDVVDLLGLRGLMQRTPSNLSGGERQRVALGRALLTQPRLLLLDEPLSSLDPAAKAEILPYLERLLGSLAIPALYVSHDLGEIRRLADRLLIMENGAVRSAVADLSGRGAHAAAEQWLAAMTPDEIHRLALDALLAARPEG